MIVRTVEWPQVSFIGQNLKVTTKLINLKGDHYSPGPGIDL